MTTTKKLLAIALAAATLGTGSLTLTASDASAKGWKGGHHHKWHGHRWRGRHFFSSYDNYDDTCYFVRKRHGRVIKICPDYFY